MKKTIKEKIFAYAEEEYGSRPEYLWEKYPDTAVLRRADNRKWYAVFMRIPRSKLGLSGDEMIDIVDIKADPAALGSLILQDGIFRGWHMNKANWITIALDGAVPLEQIFILLDFSYSLAGNKKKNKKAGI